MFAKPLQKEDSLPADHACAGCPVRGSAICSVLDCNQLAELRSLGSTISLGRGEALFHEGDPASRVFSLTSGSLRLYKLLPDGRRQVTSFLYPGDFLGIALGSECAFTAEALEKSELCCFPRKRFSAFGNRHPMLESELYRVASHELAVAQDQILLLGRKTAAERFATFLEQLASRSGDKIDGHTQTIRLPMSRSDIADYLGLTKETISRVIGLFRNHRLVRLERMNRIQLLDRERLQLVAAGALDA